MCKIRLKIVHVLTKGKQKHKINLYRTYYLIINECKSKLTDYELNMRFDNVKLNDCTGTII